MRPKKLMRNVLKNDEQREPKVDENLHKKICPKTGSDIFCRVLRLCRKMSRILNVFWDSFFEFFGSSFPRLFGTDLPALQGHPDLTFPCALPEKSCTAIDGS